MATSDSIDLKADSQTLSDRAKFEQLADEWERERPRGVDIEQMTSHPAYRQIIDMGTPAGAVAAAATGTASRPLVCGTQPDNRRASRTDGKPRAFQRDDFRLAGVGPAARI